jgi:hypothetical protein
MHVLIVFAAFSALAGCAERAEPPFEPIRLVAGANAARDDRFLTWGGTVTIDGIERRVLSAATPVTPPVEIAPEVEGGQAVYRGPLPAEFKPVPWILIQAVATTDGVTKSIGSWPAIGGLGGTPFRIPYMKDMVPPGGKAGIVLRPVPDLATRDVETPDVTIPARAVLVFGVGLETASQAPSVIPVDMTVSALADGREIGVDVVRLEPRRHVQWVDRQVPLDELAGRVVRFRFTARPIMGPTAVPTLPVWADPTIVDARMLGR